MPGVAAALAHEPAVSTRWTGGSGYLTISRPHLDTTVHVEAMQSLASLPFVPRLVLDLSGVRSIDAGGLGLLVGIIGRVGPAVEIVLAGCCEPVREMIRSARLESMFLFMPAAATHNERGPIRKCA